MKIPSEKEKFSEFFEQARKLYKDSFESKLNAFPESVRRQFYINGDRKDFEKLYFRRRDFLSSCAVLALFEDKYISQLEKIILAICDEYCWALPAHTDGTKENDSKTVDLFVAETGFTLAEISVVFGDKLSKFVQNKIKNEIEKRLVKNYIENTFWWEECRMNWASVCAGLTGGTLIYLFPDEFRRQKDRLLKSMRSYVDGFSDDGYCPEGSSYWLYGFSAYTYFADLLFTFTNGQIDLFTDEKVQKIAGFMGKCFLTGNTSVSFSDGDMCFKADLALQHYLAKRLPTNVRLLSDENMSVCGCNTKWPCFYRTLLWVDCDRKENRIVLKNYYSENQIIINKEKYSFALKGGHNNEPHNHNDLGSFIVADKNGQVLCDLGAGRYTKDYFNENRYTIFCNSSLGHNVPIINGKEQSAGTEYDAKLFYEENKAVADITNAYKEPGLQSFIRMVEFYDSSVIITDSFKITVAFPITERFVTLRKPEIKGNVVALRNTKIIFDDKKTKITINENYHIPHEYDKEPVTVYCLDFELSEGENEIKFQIET